MKQTPKPVTSSEFSSFRSEQKSTKKTIFSELNRLEVKVDNNKDEIIVQMEKQKKEILNVIGRQHDQVMTAISNFAGRVEKLEGENELGADQIARLDKRISHLENPS